MVDEIDLDKKLKKYAAQKISSGLKQNARCL